MLTVETFSMNLATGRKLLLYRCMAQCKNSASGIKSSALSSVNTVTEQSLVTASDLNLLAGMERQIMSTPMRGKRRIAKGLYIITSFGKPLLHQSDALHLI
jgi:hypothetical protein